MASEQRRREDHIAVGQINPAAEKDNVTNMTTNFQSLTTDNKAAGEDQKAQLLGAAEIRASGDGTAVGKLETDLVDEDIAYAKVPGDEGKQQPSMESNNPNSTTTTTDQVTPNVQEKAKEMGARALEKAKSAKDFTVEKAMETAGYVSEKAVAAKEVAVEKGKVTAEYMGKVAVQVKDQAVGAGWGTARATLERLVEATKHAAEYSGEKAVEANQKAALEAVKAEEINAGEKEEIVRKAEEKPANK